MSNENTWVLQGSTHLLPRIYVTTTDHLIGFDKSVMSFTTLPAGVDTYITATPEMEIADELYHLQLSQLTFYRDMYQSSIDALLVLCEAKHKQLTSGERVIARAQIFTLPQSLAYQSI